MMNEPAVEPGRTMEALRAQARGGPEKLIYERVLPPSPGIGDVLLKVRAASFTPTELDWSSTWVDRAGREYSRDALQLITPELGRFSDE